MATTADADQTAPEKPDAKRRRRRWHWGLLACILLLALMPTLVCKSPLRNVALAAALRAASIRGQAATASMSVGWFTPITLNDLELRDPDGQVLTALSELSIDKSLFGLLFHRNEPGRIRLVRPVFFVRLKDDGSNVEELFANPIEHAQRATPIEHAERHPGMPLQIELVDGTVTLEDVVAGRDWKLEQVAFQLSRPDTNGATQFSFTAVLPQTSDQSHIKVEGSLPPPNGDHAAASRAAKFEIVDFPLESLRAIVARVWPDTAIAGQLNGQMELTQATSGSSDGKLVGDMSVVNLLVAGPRLGGDVLKLARVDVPCELSLNGSDVTVRKFDVSTDVGRLASTGNIRLSAAAAAPTLPSFDSAAGQINGQLDVAGLARLLPHHIRMRPGDQLASAPVNFQIAPRLKRDNGWVLELAPGRVLDHVEASPELCDAWLKFALPVLAEVTQVNGEFSADLEGFQLRLGQPASAQTAGTISVHNIELGPGPLVQQLQPLIEKLRGIAGRDDRQPVKRLSIARESQVEFRLVDGRVYHRGLRLQFPQFSMETYGSVGLDESLAMMAEIRLPDKWLGSGPLATALKSRPLQLPIGGTLKKPKVDLEELRGLGRQTIRETAKEVLGEELKRGLNRLFKAEPK